MKININKRASVDKKKIFEERKFIGCISKTKLFNKYREILAWQVDLYEEVSHTPTHM